jgi:hypothetical protein
VCDNDDDPLVGAAGASTRAIGGGSQSASPSALVLEIEMGTVYGEKVDSDNQL